MKKSVKMLSWVLCICSILYLIPVSHAAPKESLCGTWIGSYIGTDYGQPVERKLKLEIDFAEDDLFEGIATINEGNDGKYFFKGILESDNTISFEGIEWLFNPTNYSFSSFNGAFNPTENSIFGYVDKDEERSFSLSKTDNKQHVFQVDFSSVPRVWAGEYDGHYDNVVVNRNYEIQIENIDKAGNITGIAVFSPSSKADPAYGANGSYYFSGFINPRFGKITIQGYKWNIKPKEYENWTFVQLNGIIELSHGAIHGISEDGIWEMNSVANPLGKGFLNYYSTSVQVGKTKQLSMMFFNSEKNMAIWTSSNPEIASVSRTGKVTGKKVGKTTINVKTANGLISSSCIINVEENNELPIQFSSDNVSLKVGQIRQIIVNTESNAIPIIWESNNPDLVSVDNRGNIEAKKVGTAIITAKLSETNCSDSISVTVKNDYNSNEAITKTIFLNDEGVRGTINVSFNPQWFSDDSKNYNHNIATFASELVTIGYSNEKEDHIISNALTSLGFSAPKVEKNAGRDEENYFIANKKTKVNGKNCVLLLIGLIGSNGRQWNSNFDPLATESSKSSPPEDTENLKTHLGFLDAKNYVSKALDDYIDKNFTSINPDNTILLFMGHSRGAAAANLLAADAIKGALGEANYKKYANIENIFAYTFAGPNSTRSDLEDLHAEKYDRIYNIVNPEDFVTWVLPAAWNYGRYGQVVVLPSKSNSTKGNAGNKNKDYQQYSNSIKKFFSTSYGGEAYQSYNGEKTVYEIIKKMTSSVGGLNEFYNNPLRNILAKNYAFEDVYYNVEEYNMFKYFQNVICPFVNKQSNIGAIKLIPQFLTGNDVLCALTRFFIKNQALDPLFMHAHMAETYYAFMKSMEESDIVDAYGKIIKRSSKYYKYNCPVDITVIDKETGSIVARIENNIPAENNLIEAFVDGESKTIILPSESSFEIIITGNDNGFLDYTSYEIDCYGQEINRLNYFNVPVENGFLMEEDTVESENGGFYTAIINEFGEEIGKAEHVNAEDLNALAITAKVEGIGKVFGTGNYTAGDCVTLTATTDENNGFLGFYENDNRITEETTYSFVAKENVALTAKFTNNIVPVSKISVPANAAVVIHPDEPDLIELPVSIEPANATWGQLIWTTADETVAQVIESEGKGYVYGVGAGTTQITVKTEDRKQSCTIPVTVESTSVPYIPERTCFNARIIRQEPGIVEIAVYAEKCEGLMSADLEISYDPSVLTPFYKSHALLQGVPGKDAEAMNVEEDGAFVANDIMDRAEGKIKYSLFFRDRLTDNDNFECVIYSFAINNSDVKKTDITVQAKANGVTLEQEKTVTAITLSPEAGPIAIMLGDVDFDGEITVTDARFALRKSVGLENYEEGSPEFLACDVDFDGEVSVTDARLILRASVGLDDPKMWLK